MYLVEPIVRCLPENVLSAPLNLLGSVDEKGHGQLLNYTLANISRTVIPSSVNVTKSADFWELGHIYGRNP